MKYLFITIIGAGAGYLYGNFMEEKIKTEIKEIIVYIKDLPEEKRDYFIPIITSVAAASTIAYYFNNKLKKNYYEYLIQNYTTTIDDLQTKKEENRITYEQDVKLSRMKKNFPKIQKIYNELQGNLFIDLN